MIFDRMKKMSNVLMKKIEKIEVDPNKCLKVRAVISSCQACMNVCPANSITIKQDSLELEDTCIACGLCTAVCPTNALKWNDPPLVQLYNQLTRMVEQDQLVYLACKTSFPQNKNVSIVEVPCFGMLPMEFWISIGKYSSQLRILHDKNHCGTCTSSCGGDLFIKQLQEAEQILNSKFQMVTEIHEEEQIKEVDYNRRRFLSALFEEVKETNTIAIKEALEVNKTLSPFEKFDRYYQQQSEVEVIANEVNEIKETVVHQMLSDAVTHTDKRELLLNAFKDSEKLQDEMTFLMPEIKESCTRCGACSFLCPTDALYADGKEIILATNKCVSCQLCAEICFEKHISLVPKSGEIFNDKFIYLLKE